MHTPLRKGIFGGLVRKRTCSDHPRFATIGISFANKEAFICLRMGLPEGISDGLCLGCRLAGDTPHQPIHGVHGGDGHFRHYVTIYSCRGDPTMT